MSLWQMHGYAPTPDDPLNVKVVPECVAPVCDERLVAIIHRTFIPQKSVKAWVWTEMPLRRMTREAWREVWEHDRDSTDGQRYRYPGGAACPWCGGALPEPRWDDLDDCEAE